MVASSVTRATVVGAGVMGSGIAQVLAQAGINVALVDVDERQLERALGVIRSGLETLSEHGKIAGEVIPDVLQRIHPFTDLASAVDGAQFVEETVPEVPQTKKNVLGQLDALLPPEVAIASNTSGLDIFSFAAVAHPERLVIAHFFAPAHIIPLVEVVPGPLTAPGTVASTAALLERAGKKVVALQGFVRACVVNNIQHAIGAAVTNLLSTGLVTPQEIDAAVKYSLGIRIPIVGVMQSMDFNGLDLIRDGMRSQNKSFPLLEELVAAGHLGAKTAKGFYDYAGRSEVEILKKRDRKLLEMLDQLTRMEAFEPI